MENIYNYKIIENGSMTGNLTSTIPDLSLTDGYAIQAWWSGTPVGTLQLEVSNDGNTWTVMGESVTAVSGVGTALWLEDYAMYDKVRVVYTATSSTGTLNVQINGKGDKG